MRLVERLLASAATFPGSKWYGGERQVPVVSAALLREAAVDLDRLTEHLGDVLYILANLEPDDRCRALDEAQEFYNAICPDKKVEPCGPGVSRLIQAWELDRLTSALKAISEMSVPDQPESSGDDERTYLLRHVAEMRQVARFTLTENNVGASRSPLPAKPGEGAKT